MTQQEQLLLAAERARKRLRQGIGTQSERMVHSTVKYFLEPDESCHEVKIGSYVADIFQKDCGRIIEIQTKGFDRLRSKLESFLEDFEVTVVHPVIREKYLCWVHPETGEIVSRRRSPRKGSAADILPEIYCLPKLQNHPNLSFMALMLDVEEYRMLDGWDQKKKRGSHRMERLPLAVGGMVLLKETEDYAALLPELSEGFTRKELAQAAHLSAGAVARAVRVWERAGVISQCGKRGRQYIYQREA
ncbi:MAG: hypothetical protein HFE64_04870 [Lachnospiraceae bacterium]|jgi:hypothetical protein|nr:hypothetical protein [Lachnospiraceae bacterium]